MQPMLAVDAPCTVPRTRNSLLHILVTTCYHRLHIEKGGRHAGRPLRWRLARWYAGPSAWFARPQGSPASPDAREALASLRPADSGPRV